MDRPGTHGNLSADFLVALPNLSPSPPTFRTWIDTRSTNRPTKNPPLRRPGPPKSGRPQQTAPSWVLPPFPARLRFPRRSLRRAARRAPSRPRPPFTRAPTSGRRPSVLSPPYPHRRLPPASVRLPGTGRPLRPLPGSPHPGRVVPLVRPTRSPPPPVGWPAPPRRHPSPPPRSQRLSVPAVDGGGWRPAVSPAWR